jgi:capsular exopolysaccharide synthesis family protein
MRRLVAAVARYKWIVIGLFVVGTAAVVIASRYVPMKYVAQATLWFEIQNKADEKQGPIQSGELLKDEAWTELLRSYVVLDYVVREQRLYLDNDVKDAGVLRTFVVDTAYAPGDYRLKVDPTGKYVLLLTKQGWTADSVAVGAPIGRKLGFHWQPTPRQLAPKRVVDFSVLDPRTASNKLARKLTTNMNDGGNFMRLSFVDSDPDRVAKVVNSVANRYTAQATKLKSVQLEELRDILLQQVSYAERNMKEAEYAKQSYGIQTITLPSDRSTPITPGTEATTAPVMSAFFQMKIRNEELQKDRDAIRSVLASGTGDSLSIDALNMIPSVRGSPELSAALKDLLERRAAVRALLQQYTPAARVVQEAQKAVNDVQQTVIPNLARALISNLEAQSKVLESNIDAASNELKAIPPRAMDEARLTRGVFIAENLYNELSKRYEAARLAAESSVPDVRILDEAKTPNKPTSDPRITVVLGGIAVSLALGIAIALILDRFDPRLQYAEQVTGDLRLHVVGAVPNLGPARGRLKGAQNGQMVLEAMRGVRHRILHAYGSAGPVILTVSSPGSGDGKTFITSNLALTFADLGMRTLIIDGDTRRGQLHKLLEVSRKPGLTNYLSGEIEVESVIVSTRYPLVDIIPGGTRMANAPELLSSARMGELLAWMRPKYDVILIDSPPLGAGIDPLVLGTLSGNMLVVMRTGKTNKALADAKIKLLDPLPIRLIGTVLNGFDDTTSYRYYSYMPGYEAVDEDQLEDGKQDPKTLQPA